ncbi:MAG: hypothetical protein AABY53_01385 [Bdellovibrionota bacterium]
MILKLIITTGLSGLLMLSCEQGGSASSAAKTSDVNFAANAAFAINMPTTTDCTFDNSTLLSGSTVTAYQNSSVSFGSSCVSETRSCDNGLLSGSYSFASCSVAGPASCLFNGSTLAHGSSVEAYNISSVELGGECISEMRTCDNGVLSGSNQYASCSINLPASCLFNGQTLANEQSVNAYLTSSVAYGELCSVETRYCIDGALSGSNQYASCAVNEPAGCLFNGQSIAHGQNVTAYLNSSVSFGTQCSNETRTCDNGVLSGSNQYASCAIDQPSSCLFNGQTITHGASTTAYLESSTSSGELCDAEERFCNNGELAGSHQYASCVMDQPASCLFNGQTIADGSSVQAFGNSNVSFGDFCISQLRECKNGVLSGFGEYASCVVNQPASCLFNGQTITHGQTIIGYKSNIVNGNQKCESEVKTCNNGDLSGTFTYPSCIVKNPAEDNDHGKDKYCKKERVEKKNKCDKDDDQDNDDKNRDNKSSEVKQNNTWYLGLLKDKHREHFNCGNHYGWYTEKKKRHHHNKKNK